MRLGGDLTILGEEFQFAFYHTLGGTLPKVDTQQGKITLFIPKP